MVTIMTAITAVRITAIRPIGAVILTIVHGTAATRAGMNAIQGHASSHSYAKARHASVGIRLEQGLQGIELAALLGD